ncbi:type VII secretion protein EccB [Streptomyces armeniacus]|uniref:Type VII secretion protein EccB n=1 Tax=Streptomyces armeniacus TaxID=83291 RepID=A0A345XUU1_9ACTN|nr:type VII secretion protein EccB [Streptomyces armeniacus]AXK35407.1 type VII secretion protein EccB [Streptomyces armeniacus]
MASRRDELNAYTFAKKRLLAAFLQPTPSGTEEGAPRPLRAVVPGLIIGVVIMAGFGAWGMFKPKAPEGWDEPGQKVIIGSDSTTRYVVLEDDDGKKQLHPVLNLASGKLLLDPDKFEIVKVDEKTLDNGDIPHGATLGIPYAPDRLPDAGEASEEKRWAVCTQPGGQGETVQKAAFVLSDEEKDKVEGRNRLRGGDVMYVEGPDDDLYLVDRSGTAYPIERDPNLLLTVVGGETRDEPQKVTSDWLSTLRKGQEIEFPSVTGIGDPAGAGDGLDANVNKVGMVLRAQTGDGPQHYVVLRGQVRPVTDFMAKLLLNSKEAIPLGQHGRPTDVSSAAISPGDEAYGGNLDWPDDEAVTVNKAGSGRDTLCNVLRGVDKNARPTLSTWVSDDYPAVLPNGATSAYVSPGTGLLFRQVKGESTKSGGIFLVTDTGLRYAVQGNSDSGKDKSDIGSDKKQEEQAQEEGNKAQIRLGYQDAKPVLVPSEWSQFLPTGPRLSTGAAQQPQGS